MEPDRGGARRLVGVVMRPFGRSLYRNGSRRDRYWGKLDDRSQVWNLSASFLVKSRAVLLVVK